MIKPLLILFLLGALQGAIGWIMVASGLEGDAVYVKPTRLALHFIFALGLLSYTYWFALSLKVKTLKEEGYCNDGHFSPKGHDTLAQNLIPQLKEKLEI